jgi:formylglycine-generating enzyme required for sulfatase activity
VERGIKQTAFIGSYREGASPYGVMDMAGNVWKWCLDLYYTSHNLTVPGDRGRMISGSYGALRGGAWSFSPSSPAAAPATTACPTSGWTAMGSGV